MVNKKPYSIQIFINAVALVGVSLLALAFAWIGFNKVQLASIFGLKELVWALGLFLAGLMAFINVIGWIINATPNTVKEAKY